MCVRDRHDAHAAEAAVAGAMKRCNPPTQTVAAPLAAHLGSASPAFLHAAGLVSLASTAAGTTRQALRTSPPVCLHPSRVPASLGLCAPRCPAE